MKAIVIVALFCFSCALLPICAADSEDHPDFSGNWRLNEYMSDDPIEQMRRAAKEMMQSKGRGGGGMGGGGKGRGGMGGGGMGRGGTGQQPGRTETEQRFPELNLIFDTMEITYQDPLLTIRYPGGRERSVYTDGREQHLEDGFGPVESRARWKKQRRLVVNSTTEMGRSTIEKFELALEGRQLKIVTHVEGDGPAPAFKFTRFFDRAP